MNKLKRVVLIQQGKDPTFHLALGVDDHTSVVLEVDEDSVLPSERFPLSHNHALEHCAHTPQKTEPHRHADEGAGLYGWKWLCDAFSPKLTPTNASPARSHTRTHPSATFFPELRLSLLHRAHDHVANTSCGKAVQAAFDATDGHDEQVLGTRVVCAVKHSTDWQTQGDPVLLAGSSCTSTADRKKKGQTKCVC